MALLNLVYRDQLSPRRAYARAFDMLLIGRSENGLQDDGRSARPRA